MSRPDTPLASAQTTAPDGLLSLEPAVLAAKELTVTYENGFTALKNFTLDVRPGEIVSLLGHSDSGKSTFMKAVTGMARPPPPSFRWPEQRSSAPAAQNYAPCAQTSATCSSTSIWCHGSAR